MKAIVDRNPAFAGPVNVTLQNLPAGITAAPATIAADQSAVEIKLTAAADAATANVNNVTAKADAMAGAAKLEATSAAVVLAVD